MTIHIDETEQSSQCQFNNQIYEYQKLLKDGLEILSGRVDILGDSISALSEGLDDLRKDVLEIKNEGR